MARIPYLTSCLARTMMNENNTWDEGISESYRISEERLKEAQEKTFPFITESERSGDDSSRRILK